MESLKKGSFDHHLENYAAEDAVECLALRDGEQITINIFGECQER